MGVALSYMDSCLSRVPFEMCMALTKHLGVSRRSRRTDDHITYPFGGMRDEFLNPQKR